MLLICYNLLLIYLLIQHGAVFKVAQKTPSFGCCLSERWGNISQGSVATRKNGRHFHGDFTADTLLLSGATECGKAFIGEGSALRRKLKFYLEWHFFGELNQ